MGDIVMPSSFVGSFPAIVNLLIGMNPTKVIDIGPGWGKYGLACREYLPDLDTLHAVEVRQGRLPTQDAIYDWIYVGDARDTAYTKFWGRWEVALVIDVIEHMTLDEGHDLLGRILGAGCSVLVSTPKVFAEQHDDDNPYEEHVSLWDWRQLKRYHIRTDASTIDSIIYWLSP